MSDEMFWNRNGTMKQIDNVMSTGSSVNAFNNSRDSMTRFGAIGKLIETIISLFFE